MVPNPHIPGNMGIVHDLCMVPDGGLIIYRNIPADDAVISNLALLPDRTVIPKERVVPDCIGSLPGTEYSSRQLPSFRTLNRMSGPCSPERWEAFPERNGHTVLPRLSPRFPNR